MVSKIGGILIVVFLMMSGFGICETIDWKQYNEGVRLAKKENKKIFLHFRTDWCGYCAQMEKTTFKEKLISLKGVVGMLTLFLLIMGGLFQSVYAWAEPFMGWIEALTAWLGKHGLLKVLCEGGGTLAASLTRAALVDEWIWFTAPILLGGDAQPSLAGGGWLLDKAPACRIVSTEMTGGDVVIRARPSKPKG